MLTKRNSRARAVALIATAALVVAACGGDGTEDTTAVTAMDEMSEPDTAATSGDIDGMEMNMGDATAVAAADVAGAQLSTASFELLDSRPPGYEETAGTADMARHDTGTTVTVALTGLQPGENYISHVHSGSCSESGGPHFQFVEGGETVPPNEIHLAFTSGSDGSGSMTAENHETADDRARSVVVHPVDLLDNKVACAEF